MRQYEWVGRTLYVCPSGSDLWFAVVPGAQGYMDNCEGVLYYQGQRVAARRSSLGQAARIDSEVELPDLVPQGVSTSTLFPLPAPTPPRRWLVFWRT